MDIYVGEDLIFSLSAFQIAVIKDDIPSTIFSSDMNRRLEWVLTHKYDECLKAMIERWMPTLTARYESLPTNQIALANLIFAQEDYKDREARDVGPTP